MLLETKNISENDIIIYSRNSMDENYNFRIVFRNDPHTHHRIISFEHVKKLITEYFSKNLIAYRILCNYPDISIGDAKYSCVIMVDSQPELIFTDPVFAIHAIEEYIQYNTNTEFRFRIQKVGYTTSNKIRGETDFKEEFVFNLNIDEAINQNDEIFVETLLEKQIISKKQKKAEVEIKRNIIFKPENKNAVELLEEDEEPKVKKENLARHSALRHNRVAEGELIYNKKVLNLGKIEREKYERKQIDIPLLKKRRINLEEYQVINSARLIQRKLRSIRKKREILSAANTNDLRIKFSDGAADKKEEYQKVHSRMPLTIRKVKMNEDGSQTQVEIDTPKNHKDDLFSIFLNNIQNERISKTEKRKKKHKESDIIQMFKSVQSANLNKNGENNSNSILNVDRKGKIK